MVADLFSGAGGISLGLSRAATDLGMALRIALAVELDAGVADVFHANLRPDRLDISPVERLFEGELGSSPTTGEKGMRRKFDGLDLLVGGPPCQGFSSLNNRTRHRDPRNELYTRMARAAEILRPRAVLIENVPGVSRDKTGSVESAIRCLVALGYSLAAQTIDLSRHGVPQRRHRFLVLAIQGPRDLASTIVAESERAWHGHQARTVSWAIGDLLARTGATGFDAPSRLSPRNVERANWLVDRDQFDLPNCMRPRCHQGPHTYQSMYGRLAWDRPAQTITSGFGSMGQGRHVHPLQARVLTPHEAARLQTFPDTFAFPSAMTRTKLAEVIGNAAPPLFNASVGRELLKHLS